MHSDSCSTLKEQRNIEDLHWYLSELKQVLSYWEPLCSITLNKKDQNLNTVRALKENTYVDNLMQTGGNDEELMRFKAESTARRESARFTVHKFQVS